MGNGFKVWHYSGALYHETIWPVGQELLQVLWQKYPDNLFKEKPISNVKVKGIEPSQPQSSKAVYVPPNIRSGGGGNTPVGMPSRSINQPPPERGPIPGLPIGYKVSQGQRKKDRNAKRKETDNTKQNSTNSSTNEEGNATQAQNQSTPSANNKRNQRRQTPRQPNNQNHTNGNGNGNNNGTNSHNNTDSNAKSAAPESIEQQQANTEGGESQNNQEKPKRQRKPRNPNGRNGVATSGDPEKDKRIRTVQQKLRDISKLKARRENGENLEVNQLSKIGMESELVKELNTLKIEA